MKTVDVGLEFYHRLANRDQYQGDGKHSAIEFRNRYLKDLDNADYWARRDDQQFIVLDFSNVKKIGPSFANEAFGYFTKYTTPEVFRKKVQIIKASKVQLLIIEEELHSGYTGK